MGEGMGRGSSVNCPESKGFKNTSVAKVNKNNKNPVFIHYRKMRVWKLDIIESLDLQKYEKDLEKKGKARAILHPNRDITYDLAKEYIQVLGKNNFAMLVEYCGERNLDGIFKSYILLHKVIWNSLSSSTYNS
jgi:hypothetical protein